MQPYFNQTKRNMEDNINFMKMEEDLNFENGRQPQFFENGRQPQKKKMQPKTIKIKTMVVTPLRAT